MSTQPEKRAGLANSRDPKWRGPRDAEGYVLPPHTTGHGVADYLDEMLADFGAERLTDAQRRAILWGYAGD